MRADQLERPFLDGRQRLFGFFPLSCRAIGSSRTRKRGTLWDDAQKRKSVDSLQIPRLPDPPVEALEQEGDAQAEQETQDGAEDRVPRDPRRGGRRGEG